MEAYTAALLRELELRIGGEDKFGTIYVGGGTPTVLPSFLLVKLLRALSAFCAEGTEFTVEANPATVTLKTLKELRACGVNRLSFGVQSFNDALLKKIGRLHTAAEAREAVRLGREAGFCNINIDLIYALPGETLAEVRSDVREALALGTEHISVYGLQLEEGTVFSHLAGEGKLVLPDEETAEAMYDYIIEVLPQNGYRRYEISNFARRGFESRHNLGYWQDVPYLGLGAAAHSYLGGRRLVNPEDIAGYIASINKGTLPLEEAEPPTRENQLAEFCFLALRTAEGLNREKFAAKFGCEIESIYGEPLKKLLGQKLLYPTERGFALTELGMKYGNVAFAEFIL